MIFHTGLSEMVSKGYFVLSLGLIVSLTAVPSIVFADNLFFSYSSYYGDAASWTQSSNPTPALSNDDYTTIAVTDGAYSDNGPPESLTSVDFDVSGYYVNAMNAGLYALGGALSDGGEQIFSGSTATPVFATGIYDLDNGTLTISAAPEPASWVMMLAGFAVLGARLRTPLRARSRATL